MQRIIERVMYDGARCICNSVIDIEFHAYFPPSALSHRVSEMTFHPFRQSWSCLSSIQAARARTPGQKADARRSPSQLLHCLAFGFSLNLLRNLCLLPIPSTRVSAPLYLGEFSTPPCACHTRPRACGHLKHGAFRENTSSAVDSFETEWALGCKA